MQKLQQQNFFKWSHTRHYALINPTSSRLQITETRHKALLLLLVSELAFIAFTEVKYGGYFPFILNYAE
jgi:hypothetical protein